jgi:hypothetical protein
MSLDSQSERTMSVKLELAAIVLEFQSSRVDEFVNSELSTLDYYPALDLVAKLTYQ